MDQDGDKQKEESTWPKRVLKLREKLIANETDRQQTCRYFEAQKVMGWGMPKAISHKNVTEQTGLPRKIGDCKTYL